MYLHDHWFSLFYFFKGESNRKCRAKRRWALQQHRGISDATDHLFVKYPSSFQCIVCIRTDLYVLTHKERCITFYSSLLLSTLSSALPPGNTVDGCGYNSHCAGAWCRAQLEGEKTINGNLEDGENIFLWRRSGWEIFSVGHGLASTLSFSAAFSLLCVYLFLILLTCCVLVHFIVAVQFFSCLMVCLFQLKFCHSFVYLQ